MLTAEAIMTENVVTIRPQCSIQEAIEQILDLGISGLPVTDEEEKLVGIVTEFALLAVAYDDRVADDQVSSHMTTDVLAVEAEDAINKVVDMFIVHRVRRVPVLKGGRLVGLISRRDALRALYASQVPACTA